MKLTSDRVRGDNVSLHHDHPKEQIMTRDFYNMPCTQMLLNTRICSVATRMNCRDKFVRSRVQEKEVCSTSYRTAQIDWRMTSEYRKSDSNIGFITLSRYLDVIADGSMRRCKEPIAPKHYYGENLSFIFNVIVRYTCSSEIVKIRMNKYSI